MKREDIEWTWDTKCPFCGISLFRDLKKEVKTRVNEGGIGSGETYSIDYECFNCGNEMEITFSIEWEPDITYRAIKWEEKEESQ